MKATQLIPVLVAVAAASAVRGVPPEKQHLYASTNGKWLCLLDPSIVLLYDQINDNYCDCPDGLDEPGTNACEFTAEAPHYFYCENKGYKSGYIENYKLNDGVCDYELCCDGSDEYLSGKCPNVCGLVKDQFDNFLGTKKAEMAAAMRVKSGLRDKALQARNAVHRNVQLLKEEVAALEGALKSEAENAQLSDSNPVNADFSAYMEKLRGKFAEASEYTAGLGSQVKALELILTDLLENYNPNFNDQAVKRAVNTFADFVSNKPETSKPLFELSDFSLDHIREKFSLKVDTVAEKAPVGFLGSCLQKIIGGPSQANEAPKTPEIPKSSQKTEQLSQELKSKSADLSFYQDQLTQDFGEDDIFRAVQNKWVEKKIGDYKYRLGFLDALYQDNTLVGRFSGISGNLMHYTRGSKCWNGPQRSAVVEMVCGADHELLSVAEPEKCQYHFMLATPIVCKEYSDEELASWFVVDKAALA